MDNELQTNIKQIGTISKGSKIYIEDYVMTFIKYMEDRYVCEELIFVLLGKVKREDDEDILFISGAIEGSDTEESDGIKIFSDKSDKYISETRAEFFPELDVVGWAYVQPGYGDFLNEAHITYHTKAFTQDFHVLYITDPLDKSCAFYRRKPNSMELKPINGYFIYYDKNEPMHEYLLECKKRLSLEEPKENLTENVDSYINSKLRKEKEHKTKGTDSDFIPRDAGRLVNLLGGLSFALLFVTLIIGGGLLKSNSRIEYLEKQINSLGENYLSLQEEFVQTREVFASQNARKTESQESTVENTSGQSDVQKTDSTAEGAGQAPAEEKVENKTYTVEAGDTLISISKNFYGTDDRVEDIMQANGISSPMGLIEGKTITIPE